MSAKFHQISLKETFSECQDLFTDDAPSFFQLLDEHLDLESFIPDSFFNAFYRSLGRKRLYPLSGFLAALILQKILSIPTDSLLILFLNLCKELRDFCGFHKVPDAPLFTRFKQDFLPFIEEMFHQLVDFTEPSVWPLILHWLRCSPSILPGLNSTSPKTIPRPSTPSSAD